MSKCKDIITKVKNFLRFLGFGVILKCCYSFINIFIYILLFILKVILRRRIVFCSVTSSRIGHLAANTELFLRRLRSGTVYNERDIYIGYCQTGVANKQLLKMFQREMLIINGYYMLFKPFYTRTWITKTEFHLDLLLNSNEYHEFNVLKQILTFTDEEEKKGKKLLKEMGIGENDWFVCFHSRDSTYLNSQLGYQNWDYHKYRDSDINNYLKAIEYIAEKGGFAIRMGALVEKPLPSNRHPRIIDYAMDYRSDFMDIYLSARCKFFIGSAVGITVLPEIFNIPLVCVNYIPFEYTPWRKEDLYIPKIYLDTKTETLMQFKDIIISGAGRFLHTEKFLQAGIEVLENTPEEILEVTKEMFERLEGRYQTSKEDEILQEQFKSLFIKGNICYGSPVRIGAGFLRRYKHLLNPRDK